MVRRARAVPYIMGANITTLGDTLVTAIVIGNPDGIRVVLVELVATTSITLVLVALLYRPLAEMVVRLADWMLEARRRVLGFGLLLFCVPLVLIFAF